MRAVTRKSVCINTYNARGDPAMKGRMDIPMITAVYYGTVAKRLARTDSHPAVIQFVKAWKQLTEDQRNEPEMRRLKEIVAPFA